MAHGTNRPILHIIIIQHAMDHRKQVDLILLDFSKAFDTVPHQCLLTKLEHYGIQGDIHRWINSWLSQRTQRVVVDGESSEFIRVMSGVPQGTVLGPLMFLLYINDISNNLTSHIRLFADDCIIYRTISSPEDPLHLQEDLDRIFNWTTRWQMQLNIQKCVVLQCTRSHFPRISKYVIDGHVLELKHQHTYLGLIVNETMQWSPHINNLAVKASKVLNFIKRNLSNCSSETKASAYLSLVRPIMEYASCVWDPHEFVNIQALEKVQRAVRWAFSDYGRHSSVTRMLTQLGWPTLQHRRFITRLTFFYKIIHGTVPLTLPSYFIPTQYPKRRHHGKHFIIPSNSTAAYQQSFYPRTIREWNNLPIVIIETTDIEDFTNKLSDLNLI